MKFLFATLFLALTIASHGQSDSNLAPQPKGPWAVGRRLLQWVDSSRREPTDSTQFRSLPVWVWYPAAKSGTETAGYPLPEKWREEQGKYLSTKIGVAAAEFLQNLKTWSVPDAPVASMKEKMPVLVFGPGLTWLPADYSALIEEIVSYGYIVIGYVPTGFPVTQLAGGKIVPVTLGIQQQDMIFDDALFVEKHLYYLESSGLKDLADIHTVGVFGHSIGGAAALVTAGKDSSVKAVADLDGDLMGSALAIKVLQPSLFLNHDESTAIASAVKKMDKDGRERSEYRRHADWVRATDDSKISLRIRLTGTYHLNFTDLGLLPITAMTENERKDKLGNADGNSSLKTIAGLTREFFDFCLKHTAFYTMVGLEEKYPQAQALLWKGIRYN